MSRRVVRRAPIVVVLLAVAGFLAACQKPLPTITVFGDGKSVIVDAALYQFAGGPNHQPVVDYGQAKTLTVTAGSDLLVDVPRTVAKHTWVVAAFRLDENSKSTPIDGAGSLETLSDTHSTRVSTTPAGVGDYFLQVAEFRGGAQTGGWVVKIRTKS